MDKKTKIILIVIIALIIAGMAFYPKIKAIILAENDTPPPATSAPTPGIMRNTLNVNAQILKTENLTDVIRTKGLLIPDEEVDLSFETSGKITEISFNEGTKVRKGQLLAKVNDKPLQAELKKLEAQIPLAQDRVYRQKALLAKDAVSQEAYESVNTELDKLLADIELTKARIAQTELRAPFDGVIGLRQVSEGTYASPTTIISRLTKVSPLKIEFSVNEAYANNVKAGTPLTFSFDNDLNNYGATVYAVESNLDKMTFSQTARALYPNVDGRLKPGQSTNIEIRLQEIKNTIVIPSLSTIAEMGRDIAYIYKEGKAHQVTVKKGMRTASSVQILNGLNEGDTLLVTGVMQLRDGLPVKIDTFVEK
ncbi:efflux RND transporter periplasmic adaptor subunit [Prevotella sp. 10(H)]|uniref:efflux RND transporter periplasmic adaptor subunit n=1 Tax=Prevotella sp. 10(H) TaxID=1158294 RepID=UPI0004A6C0B7|nr:efflux RND transporter periplasmic adaptor subunit [Prevotella sp. 10(H)]